MFYFKSTVTNDKDENGGVISITPILDNIVGSFLPNISIKQAKSGITRARKLFELYDPQLPLRIFFKHLTSVDKVLIHKATENDTWEDAQDYTGWKGNGKLLIALDDSEEITSIQVKSENEGIGFNPLDLICISDDTNEEYIRIKSVSWNGDIATILPFPGIYLLYSYAINSKVLACIERGLAIQTVIWIKQIIDANSPYKSNNQIILKGVI